MSKRSPGERGWVPIELLFWWGGLAMLICAVVLAASAAFAQTGGGWLGGDNIGAGVGIPDGPPGGGAGTPDGPGVGSGGGGSTEPPVENVPCELLLADGFVNSCPPPGSPAPPPPPPPPTAAEAANLVPLPAPEAGFSPSGDGIPGLTGLPTYVWDAGDSAAKSVTATIRGYSVTTTAQPVSWRWTMEAPGEGSSRNPDPVIISSVPGSPDAPAGSYTYETAGPYTVSLSVTWSASFTFAGRTVALGTTTRTSAQGYQVGQLRPVIHQ